MVQINSNETHTQTLTTEHQAQTGITVTPNADVVGGLPRLPIEQVPDETAATTRPKSLEDARFEKEYEASLHEFDDTSVQSRGVFRGVNHTRGASEWQEAASRPKGSLSQRLSRWMISKVDKDDKEKLAERYEKINAVRNTAHPFRGEGQIDVVARLGALQDHKEELAASKAFREPIKSRIDPRY